MVSPPKPKISKMSRSWVYTLNNYSDDDIVKLEALDSLRHICAREVGKKTGNSHLQGYVRFSKPCRFSWWKNQFPTIHVEIRRGTESEAVEYCQKDGDIVIDKGVTTGDRPQYSSRSDEAMDVINEFRNGGSYGQVRERHLAFFFFNRRHVVEFLHDERVLQDNEKYTPTIKDDL